jgi:TldD protein
MKRQTNISFIALFILFSTFSALAQTNLAETDVLIKALTDEMNRSVNQLQLKDFGKPYFIEYGIEDEESFGIQAEFGAINSSGFDHNRNASVQVRIGNYDSDNTNLFAIGALAGRLPLALDDDYDAIRHDLWLATDAAYKSAIEQASGKKAFLQNNIVEEKLPDLTREKPTIDLQPRQKLQVDSVKWTKFIRELSAIFKKYPEISDSNVSFFVRSENRYLINNEGTRLREPSLLISLNIYAQARTIDNLKLAPSKHFFAQSFEKMPSFEEITKQTEKLAQDLTKLRNAPTFEDTYIGPALFTDRAAAQVFAQLIAPNLAADRSPLAARGATGGIFSERMNRRILPPNISIVDDPTKTELNGQTLLGSYIYDEQGVSAKPLTIVDNGILKNLLTSRVPIKNVPNSNGRARSSFGRPFISNLLVQAKDGKSIDDLKKDMLDLCRAQNLPYGILFREIDSTFFPSGRSLTPPILAYKVFVSDGREELVRNLSIDAFPVRELRQILGVGNDQFTINELIGAGQRGSGTAYSVTAPSILMDEIVLRKDTTSKVRPLIVTNPFFDKVK